ncbi:MAG: hypothetical protein GSR86_08305 [Desulfurococcales archaeon]|nr:hypothetical protein [Desulfurococcales archaeon]
MKTIAVDEETWNKLRILREKLKAKSYDEVIQLLIEAWKNAEVDRALSSLQIPDDIAEDLISLIDSSKRKGTGRS